MTFVARRPWLVLALFLGVVVTVFPILDTMGFFISTVTYTSRHVDTPKRHLINPILKGLFALRLGLTPDRRVGLPQIRLYMPEQARGALVEDLPGSIKRWQEAKLLYPDGRLRRAKVRLRGDNNLRNYAFSKKAWRIKTRRKNLFDGRRIFSFRIEDWEDMIGEAVATWIAREAGVVSPRLRPVELFINDESQGIVSEIEHPDELFLRSNGIMPVNLYKGDFDSDWILGLSWDLFYAPTHWSKVAVNNRYPEGDRRDLLRFFDLLRDAATSETAFRRLRRLAPFDEWARFAAFQVLVQSWHNDYVHNQRLIVDDQAGTVRPVPWDTDVRTDPVMRLSVDSHPLFTLYKQHGAFVLAELRALHRLLGERRILAGARDYVDSLAASFRISLGRDVHRIDVLPVRRVLSLLVDPLDNMRLHEEIKDDLAKLESWLVETLTAPPSALWSAAGGRFDLFVDGVVPVGDVTLRLAVGAPSPSRLAIDADGDGRLGAADTPLAFRDDGASIAIDAVWLANRMISHRARDTTALPSAWTARLGPVTTAATRFSVVADVPLQPTEVRASNAITGGATTIPAGTMKASPPSRWNRPVISLPTPVPEVWRGRLRRIGVEVFERPVRIEAGTVIEMAPGASLVFRAGIVVEGTAQAPVMVTASGDAPWGVVALQGPGSAGSRLNHLRLEGGSGAFVDGVNYTAMLSIHDTRDVNIRHLSMRRNDVVDDMLHVVYGRGIHISDLDLATARADAIDIDISDVTIVDGLIDGAGNDCIDLMTSTALLERLSLVNCGDKGVSVGERSLTLINDSVITGSAIGVESKDASLAQVLNTDFLDNRVQINAYGKNWRYGDGGRVDVRKTYFRGRRNVLTTDKRSRVAVRDSSIVGAPETDDGVELAADVDLEDRRRARAADDGEGLLVDRFPAIRSQALVARRGAAP